MATSGEAAAIHHIMKAGWMQRESDFLRKWKRQYVILRTNGFLSYYTNETQMDLQGSLNLTRDCFCIKSAGEVGGVGAPQGRTVGCLLEVRTSQANVVLCAESDDDAQSWKIAMLEAMRVNRGATQNHTVVANTVVGTPTPYTVVTPGARVTTYRTVTQQQQGCPYPVQQTMYAYPGQTIVNGRTVTTCTYPAQTMYNGQTVTTYQVPAPQTRVYQTQTQYYYQ